MNRPRITRWLQIAWSVAWGIAAVLLIALWVRSYWCLDILKPGRHEVWVAMGKVQIDETWVPSSPPTTTSSGFSDDGTDSHFEVTTVQTMLPAGTGTNIPFWFPTITSVLLATAPWLRWRFTLRTLLIATTLVAVGLGTVVWLSR